MTRATVPHRTELRVRYGETDQMGVVYHANYLVYMEEGRTDLLRSLGVSYAELEKSGWILVVRRDELRFRAPAHYDESLVVRTRVDRLRAASARFAYELERVPDGTLLAEGSTELACLRQEANGGRSPTTFPDDLRARLQRAMP